MEYLNVITNGGNGGNGQYGGDGHRGDNGENGVGISLETLKSRFPSPAKTVGKSVRPVLKLTMIALNSDIHEFRSDLNLNIDKNTSIYKKGKSLKGNEIEFSFYNQEGIVSIFRDSYLLYCGSQGQPGKPGGLGGLGGAPGDGGFAGMVNTFCRTGKKSNVVPKKEDLNGQRCNGRNGK